MTQHPAHTELWQAYERSRSVADRNALVEAYLWLVKALAIKMARNTPYGSLLDFYDFVSAGTIGLMRAIELYDRSKGVRFTTYAPLRIRGVMIDHVRDVDWAPRFERKKNANFPTVRGLDNARDRLGRRVHPIDSRTPKPADLARRGEWIDDLPIAVTSQERAILKGYYEDNLTMAQVGRRLRLSESRVSQVHTELCLRIKLCGPHAVRSEGARPKLARKPRRKPVRKPRTQRRQPLLMEVA
jgi:RNA polymerase sigma factor (sigma-70 family)